MLNANILGDDIKRTSKLKDFKDTAPLGRQTPLHGPLDPETSGAISNASGSSRKNPSWAAVSKSLGVNYRPNLPPEKTQKR